MAINSNRVDSVSTGSNGVLSITVSDTTGATSPITVFDLKDWMKIDSDDDNGVIEMLIDSVIDEIENEYKFPIKSKDVVATWGSYGGSVVLPYAPVSSITSVVTTDSQGNTETLTDGEEYRLVGNKLVFDQIYLSEVPYNKIKLTVTYVSAYSSVPKGILLGLRKAILDNYENRESVAGFSVTKIPDGAHKKFKQYMRYT